MITLLDAIEDNIPEEHLGASSHGDTLPPLPFLLRRPLAGTARGPSRKNTGTVSAGTMCCAIASLAMTLSDQVE